MPKRDKKKLLPDPDAPAFNHLELYSSHDFAHFCFVVGTGDGAVLMEHAVCNQRYKVEHFYNCIDVIIHHKCPKADNAD